jgi:low temperature requirement protein LtrA
VIDLVATVLTLPIQRRLPRLTTSHLPERYGLFTLIVLGEAVAGAIRGVAESADGPALSLGATLAGALGLALAFGRWGVPVDSVRGRSIKRGVAWTVSWSYLHLPLLMALTAIGAGVAAGIVAGAAGAAAPESGHAAPPEAVRLLVSGAVAVVFLVLALMETVLVPVRTRLTLARHGTVVRLMGAALAVVVVLLSPLLGLTPLLALLLVAAASQIVYATYLHQQPK